MKRVVDRSLLVLVPLLAIAGPAIAGSRWSDFFGNGNSLFGNFSNSLGQYITSIVSGGEGWQLLLRDDPCESSTQLPAEEGWCTDSEFIGNSGSISSIFADSVGDLDIPDPGRARSLLQEKVYREGETSAPLQPNPSVYGGELGNVSDRAATNLNSRTVLDQEGQQRIQQEIERGNELVQSVLDTSNQAQGYEATQDVVKALARIHAQQTVLANLANASSLRERIDRQFTNLNLANISRSLDRELRYRQSQSVIDSTLLFRLSSQIKLF